MSGLDIFAIIVLAILVIAATAVWVALAMLPGKIAQRRDHPQAEAINVGGWLGALSAGVLWPIFLIWAYTKPVQISQENSAALDTGELRKRIEVLEAKFAGTLGKRT